MRVGLLYEQTGPQGNFDELVGQVQAADTLGFDSVWITERHFVESSLGSPSIVLAALAKCTRAARLGVLKVMGIGHPIRTAEDFAMVDLLSGGRLNFGAAVGRHPEDFRGYRVPFDERTGRFHEALDLVLHAWSADEFSYAGRYYQFPKHTPPGDGVVVRRRDRGPYLPQWERGPETPDLLTVTPKPLQEPRPPVWVLADEDALIDFAAARGHSLVLPAGELAGQERAAARYEAGLASAHRARHEVEIAVVVDLEITGKTVSAETLAYLHRLQAATGLNHVIWRAPYPDVAHERLVEVYRHFAAEVQPMLQA